MLFAPRRGQAEREADALRAERAEWRRKQAQAEEGAVPVGGFTVGHTLILYGCEGVTDVSALVDTVEVRGLDEKDSD